MLQMESARRSVITKEVRTVAESEDIPPEALAQRIAEGKVVVTRNPARRNVNPIGIGQGLRTKVNANIGTSPDLSDLKMEIEKAKLAVKAGADTIMDLSTAGDLDEIRRTILEAVRVPVGTVPIYQAAIEAIKREGSIVNMSEGDVLNTVEKHAKDGVDFVTVHAGIRKATVEHMKEHRRTVGIVSRGGTFLAAWMLHNNEENPLLSNYDQLLDIAKEHDLCLSLGDALRPGSIADATDEFQIDELLTIGELVERAWKNNVQVMVEGPGHIPIHEISANIQLEKTICKGAPFYVLGPLPTDIAAGYDHITGAIGGALAGLAGADFLCYVTPAEHLGLPTGEDVVEGVVVTRIAAHIADIAKLGSKASKWDMEMAEARAALNWKEQLALAINPEKATKIHNRVKSSSGACSMCGDWCVFKILGNRLVKPTERCN
nr:phosphomethylpyrimidine synthase ThiC [Candidatus Njordarchaeota archaeon]